MIKVTVELVPLGDEYLTENIGVLYIVNDGTGTVKSGNYSYHKSKKYSSTLEREYVVGSIKDFPRKDKEAWALLYEILKQEENKK